ncbi:hypothetical protein QR721_11690 [Aciduricibacillus chroicocephali]|uniref:Uncharacterized protein n=1 Tax=Aciduricibacillus chroicocephali TaxID=3054939 RepID=A0ABY9KUR3_9BACI|nr:hypothetical protein QR721_11690 [Bacillaceae bacterium 44XB]
MRNAKHAFEDGTRVLKEKAAHGAVAASKVIDQGITNIRNLSPNLMPSTPEGVVLKETVENERIVENKVQDILSKFDVNLGTKGTVSNSSSKDVYGPYYDEAKKLHETNPDWYPNPDESTIVKDKELKEARADYQALVRRGELEKGHHVQGLSFGGENTSSNIKNTGESTIRREQIDDMDLEFYHEMGYGKENAKVLKIHENEKGIIVFGNNPKHTEVTVFQNKVLKWQRESGKR